jgi:hypothetical protein
MLSRTKLFALVVVAALAVATAASVSDATTEASKRLKCKRGFVVVKINKKASCRRLRSVFPKPRAGNRTLITLKAALNIDRSELRTKRGKRPRALPRRVAIAQKKGRKAMLRALPKLGAMLRRLEQRAGSSRSRRARAMAARRDCGGPGSTQPVSETGRSGDLGIQATMGPNGEEGGVMTFNFNGITQETTFTQCGNNYYYVSGCPKSNGDAATTGHERFTVTIRTLQGGRLLNSQSTDWTYDDRLLGKVMDDAKLRYFDLTRKEHKLTVGSGALVQAGDATRTIRVNMPSGNYDGPHSSANITGDPNVFHDDDLAASIKMAIQEYKEAENGGSFLHTDGWATFDRQRDPYCAKAQFSPAADAITVKKGQQYQLSVYAKAQDGGRATGARWTVMDPSNATFTPGSATGPTPTINYTVSSSPSGDRVRVTLKFTSTAGVGKDSWTEPIGGAINHISGTFNTTYNVNGSILSTQGNANYDRQIPAVYDGASGTYFLTSGELTIVASGKDSAIPSCTMSGSKVVPLGDGSGTMDVTSTVFGGFDPPYTYFMNATPLGPSSVVEVTRSNCANWSDNGPGVVVFQTPGLANQGGPQQSPDGIVYDGSMSTTQSVVTFTQSWSFRGRE